MCIYSNDVTLIVRNMIHLLEIRTTIELAEISAFLRTVEDKIYEDVSGSDR